MAIAEDVKVNFSIITLPIVGKWVKIGEVYKESRMPWQSRYSKFAVLEMIKDDGMRSYKEVYMASDDSQQPVLKSQSCELELKK